jgi:hypothetical protein
MGMELAGSMPAHSILTESGPAFGEKPSRFKASLRARSWIHAS